MENVGAFKKKPFFSYWLQVWETALRLNNYDDIGQKMLTEDLTIFKHTERKEDGRKSISIILENLHSKKKIGKLECIAAGIRHPSLKTSKDNPASELGSSLCADRSLIYTGDSKDKSKNCVSCLPDLSPALLFKRKVVGERKRKECPLCFGTLTSS